MVGPQPELGQAGAGLGDDRQHRHGHGVADEGQRGELAAPHLQEVVGGGAGGVDGADMVGQLHSLEVLQAERLENV